MNWGTNGLMWYYLRLLLWLFTALSGLSIIYLIARRNLQNVITWRQAMIWGMILKSREYTRIIGLMAMAGVIGWAARDMSGFRNTYTLTNLTVIAVPGDSALVNGVEAIVPDGTYWVQRREQPVGQAWPVPFCQDYIPSGLHQGSHIEILAYEMRFHPTACYDINRNTNPKVGIIFD